ncbi:MAG: ATP-dependent DNA helicase RecG [Tannerella sp.]|nr:ATP-dependent DNA helicase RecG [Tannerella sp.]
MNLEDRSIVFLPCVWQKRADVLKKEAKIVSFEDLLYYFPYRYIDRSKFYKVEEIHGEMPEIQLKGKILYYEYIGEGRTKRLVAKFTDGTDTIDLVWFNGHKFITDKYKPDKEIIVFGKPTEFKHTFNIVHPDIDPIENAAQVANGLMPMYGTTELMKKSFINSRAIQDMQFALLKTINRQVDETLPPYLLARLNMVSISEAMCNIHFPESVAKLQQAQIRLKFDELFYIQLNILKTATLRRNKLQGLVFGSVGDMFNTFYRDFLPFTLTEAQKRVIREIRADLGSKRQMNRLLQGDVGSGKTLVALMTMLLAIDNGHQACLMAPTEILANQHFITLKDFLGNMDVKIELLTGSTKQKQRYRILPELANGQIDIIVGTHALLEDAVVFRSLGLAVIDEQHRFGVEQRSRLWVKNPQLPHVLIMTATPIPRTLAMTLYGDLDVSVIDELPPGRKPIKTVHRYDNKKAELFTFLRSEILKGRQAYIVFPMIKESEKSDYKNLEEGFEIYRKVFPEFTVGMVHGQMKSKEKDAQMQRFVNGEVNILVATTVIEVGVNVPNASVMIIESAERFGLSQLHQLRGRVGRGAEQSYCVLLSSFKLSNVTRRRLEIMVSTNDGFKIAEEDLQLRGAGDLEGTAQSGEGLFLKIANIAQDGRILQFARDTAQSIINADPNLDAPENQILNARLQSLFHRKINWGLIS